MASFEKLRSEISTVFLVLSLPVALVLSNYNADEESRTLIFKEEVPNKALQGHVIRTEQVLNEGSCRVQCYLEPNCVSINVGPLKGGSHKCELNNVTDEKKFAAALNSKTGYTYNAVENLCSSSPCFNYGTCQAGFTNKGFRCICPVWARGKRCGGDLRVACFKGADKLTKLGNFANKVKWDNTDEIVEKCANLAKKNGSTLFALGRGGVCLSGKNIKGKYHADDTKNATCNHGIGMEDSMFVYSLEPLPELQPMGCFLDVSNDRALPNQFANLRENGGIERHWQVKNRCARVANFIGYEYFAIHHYGECYGGGKNYSKHGNSTNCKRFGNNDCCGVGKENASFVYKIKN